MATSRKELDHWNIDVVTPSADQLSAAGVTINPGAMFSPSGRGTGALATCTVFTVNKDTGAAPISGTFSNLPDGGAISVSGNNFQANYAGGDGSDLP